MNCPICGSDKFTDQPTVGTNYRQRICFDQYLTKKGIRSDIFKCGYFSITSKNGIVFETNNRLNKNA